MLTASSLAERSLAWVTGVTKPHSKEVTARLHRSDPPMLYETQGSTILLNLHEGQYRAWNSERRIVAIVAGSQGGKTSFGPWWLYREILRCGGGDYIAATATFDLFKLKLLPAIREVFEHVLRIGRYWSGDKVIEIANPHTGEFKAQRADDPMWARIILRSASSAGGLESTTAKGALLDEAGQDEFSLDAYDAVTRRLTLHQGRICITTTPYNLGWLKQQIIDKADSDPDIDLIQFPSVENPAFPPAEFDRLRQKLPDWKFNMFHLGLLKRPPGMIYSDFVNTYREEGGHKVHPFALPTEWPRFVGVDPGAVHTAKIWLAHDTGHNVFYLYRESLEGDKSTPEHARGALELAEKHRERVITWHVGQKAETQQRLDWKAAGVPNVKEPSVHDVESGIDRVIQLWKQFRLYVFDTCSGILDEIGRYRRKVDAQGNTMDEIHEKATFHRLDALRYVAIGVGETQATLRLESAPSFITERR